MANVVRNGALYNGQGEDGINQLRSVRIHQRGRDGYVDFTIYIDEQDGETLTLEFSATLLQAQHMATEIGQEIAGQLYRMEQQVKREPEPEPEKPLANCFTCMDTYEIERTCKTCDGLGEVRGDDHMWICDDCDGEGMETIDCPDCTPSPEVMDTLQWLEMDLHESTVRWYEVDYGQLLETILTAYETETNARQIIMEMLKGEIIEWDYFKWKCLNPPNRP